MRSVFAWYKWRICTQLRLVFPFLYPIAVFLQILNFHSNTATDPKIEEQFTHKPIRAQIKKNNTSVFVMKQFTHNS